MEQFDGRQSLALIESMINKAKNNFSESGTLYLVWGIVVFICAFSQCILIDFFHYENSYAVWFLTWLVVIYQVIFLSRKRKKNVVVTYTDEILKYVWLCFTFCLILVILLLIKLQFASAINPMILVMYGMPTFLSGAILRFRPLIIGAVICWLLSIGSIFSSYNYQLLFICAAVLSAWIIPGVLLRKKFRESNGR